MRRSEIVITRVCGSSGSPQIRTTTYSMVSETGLVSLNDVMRCLPFIGDGGPTSWAMSITECKPTSAPSKNNKNERTIASKLSRLAEQCPRMTALSAWYQYSNSEE